MSLSLYRPDDLYPYQKRAVDWQCTHHASALWIDPGLGKTVITLTSIAHLIDSGFLKNILIVAPIRVIRLVWRQEASKWTHLHHLRFSMVTGTKDQRIRGLLKPADIYLINYEALRWLGTALTVYFKRQDKPLPFDGLVWDEITKCKNSTTFRVRAIKNHLPAFKWITGLTGEPAPNGYKDLHGQYLVLDNGQRLGTSKTRFKETYFYKKGFKLIPYDTTPQRIQTRIADITLQMSEKDYRPLPDLITNDIVIELPPDLRERYNQLEHDFFFSTTLGTKIEVFNKASLGNKCLQFSNGAVYPIPGEAAWEALHDLKLKALDDILSENNGQPVLCAYAYRSDALRIMTYFKALRPINLTACTTENALNNALHRWKSNDCRLMIGHPDSMGHGIDGLQENGHVITWFGLTWALDLYKQFNARLRRNGQLSPVVCNRILTQDTMDEVQSTVLASKAGTQSDLKQALSTYYQKRYHPG